MNVEELLGKVPERVQIGVVTGLAAGLPVALAGALVPFRTDVPNATIALGLAALVSVLAAIGSRQSAALAALSASLGFDLFHTQPYGSLAVHRAEDVETTVLLLVVGLIVGQLATRNRHHRRLVAATSHDLGRIHATAEMLATGAPPDQVVLAVANELTDLLHLRECRFSPTFADRPGPFIERYGDVLWGAIRWDHVVNGLPGKEVTLVVEHQGLPLGRYVLLGQPGVSISTDQLVTAVALADQVGTALWSRQAAGG